MNVTLLGAVGGDKDCEADWELDVEITLKK